MGRTLETVWDIDPHTLAKHVILRRYWAAWLPIMTTWNGRVLYIDGFAGPGRYRNGEDGSPIIALKTARDHSYKPKAEVIFIFIEKERARFLHLVDEIEAMKPSLPSNFKCECVNGSFNEEMSKVFRQLEEQRARRAPSLVFIDPFGFSHTPFDTICKIMESPRCEVLITFMYEEINRFLGHPDHAATYDSLFGTTLWREVLSVDDPNQRRRMIHDIYRGQLEKGAKVKFVRSFEMLNSGNRTDYYLFFGTNQLRGLEKMKEAMRKADRLGTYEFSDYAEADRTMRLFPAGPDYDLLQKMILSEFSGREVSIDSLGDFVVSSTPFLRSHFKRQILTPLEKDGKLTAKGLGPSRRRGTYPEGTMIRFG
jgi:three-Cys-motif partner protein